MALFLLAAVPALTISPGTISRPARTSPITLLCEWEAMVTEQCEPSTGSLGALADTYSPARARAWSDWQNQRRESVRVLSVSQAAISIEEVLSQETHCIALNYEVSKEEAVATMEAHEAADDEPMSPYFIDKKRKLFVALRELASVLNESPAAVRALASCYSAEHLGQYDVLESARVREVSTSKLTVELSVVDMLEMGEADGDIMPRRMISATIPLPRTYDSADAVEEALLEMIDVIM